jgi:predicted MPP superfamily phosphohydrolase
MRGGALAEGPRESRALKFGRWLVAGVAAFGVWAVIVNHEVIGWQDTEAKRFTIVALALVLSALAAVPLWLHWRGPWTRAGVVVVLALAAGEVRRAWLRYAYAAERAGVPPIELLKPITTTDLRVVHFDARLPALSVPKLRLVHVTDLHITEALPKAYYAHLLEEIAARKPDLLLFTGDFLSQAARLPLLKTWLSGLPHARYGNYAVLGNHDHWVNAAEVRAVLVAADIELLSGTCSLVPVASGSVRLCGTEAPWGPGLGRAAIDSGAPGNSPLFVMSHTPDNVYALHELGADLVFAGHTHGGQMRLPVLGSVIVPSRYGRRFDLGHFNVEGTHLYVSAGVGADEPPVRIYCPPELVEVDVRRDN